MSDRIKLVNVFAGGGFIFDEPVPYELHLYADGSTVYFYFDKSGNLEGIEVGRKV